MCACSSHVKWLFPTERGWLELHTHIKLNGLPLYMGEHLFLFLLSPFSSSSILFYLSYLGQISHFTHMCSDPGKKWVLGLCRLSRVTRVKRRRIGQTQYQVIAAKERTFQLLPDTGGSMLTGYRISPGPVGCACVWRETLQAIKESIETSWLMMTRSEKRSPPLNENVQKR